jgi:hypothetical protein
MEPDATAPLDEGAVLLARVHEFPSEIRRMLAFFLLAAHEPRQVNPNAVVPASRGRILKPSESPFLITPTPIKTLAVVNWLYPGYTRNNANAKRTRMVAQTFIREPNGERAGEEIAWRDQSDRHLQENEKKRRLGYCSCCGYGGCKRAYMPYYKPPL